MPGPLPNPQRRRRNAPTINPSDLPHEGRKGRIPKCPYALGDSGRAWWRWAWRLPQAVKWDTGSHYALARRAQLEDELAAVSEVEGIDLDDLVGLPEKEMRDSLDFVIGRLQSRVSGSTTLMREMRELDKRFGLDPKAMAEMRWTIAAAPEAAEAVPIASARGRLRAVDPSGPA